MYLVFKSQLSQVALGTTQDIPGIPHYFTPTCQSQMLVIPSCHGTTQDIPGTPHQPASPRSKLPWDNSGHPRNLTLPYTILLSQVAMGQPRTSREPPNTLHQSASPRCKLSQVAMGQPRTSQDIPGHPRNLPLPYTIPPVPAPSCPKLPCDNPGHPRNSPLPYTNLLVPGPSCHGTTQDILGTPTTLQQPASPRCKLSHSSGHPGNSHYLTPSRQSQVRVVPSCHGTTQDIPGTSHYLTPSCKSQVQKQQQLKHKQ